jgi:hypothetical protein
MATWITHLRIAENLIERIPGLAAAPFPVGNIAPDGFMKLYDQRTGEDWTTHYGNATSTKIDLYDFVDNNYNDVDRILLQR